MSIKKIALILLIAGVMVASIGYHNSMKGFSQPAGDLDEPSSQSEVNLTENEVMEQNPQAQSSASSSVIVEGIANTSHTLPPASEVKDSFEVMAWIYPGSPGCNAEKEFTDGRNIDVLKPEFFTVNGGTLTLIDDNVAVCNGYSPKFVSKLKAFSSKQYVTVSSASAADMDTFFESTLSNGEDIDTLVNFVVQNDMTGIEIDFEDFGGWNTDSYRNYKLFVTRLGNALHAKNKELILNAPAIASANEQTWFLWRYEDFTSLPVDKIVVMLYDYQFDHGAGEPVAPLGWMSEVIGWIGERYPKNKLSIGIPSYGYEARVGKRPYIRTYDQLKNVKGFSQASRDPGSAELTWTAGGVVYFYQDTESLRQKISVVEKAGITSVSIWHLGGNPWF